jgi:hypothetical protein
MEKKEINIQIRIADNKIGTIIKHNGFTDTSEYTMEQILITIGVLEHLKMQMQEKMKGLGVVGKHGME